MKSFKTNLLHVSQQKNLRINYGYRKIFDKQHGNVIDTKRIIKLYDVMQPITSKKITKGQLDCEYMLVDMCNVERRNNTLIDVVKVAEIGSDKSLIENGDIVIPKMQAYLGKMFLNTAHEQFLSSTEFIEYIIDKSKFQPLFLYFLLNFECVLDSIKQLESGKAQRRANSEDLLLLNIPFVAIEKQEKAEMKIVNILEIVESKRKDILSIQEIIDSKLANFFSIDINTLNNIANEKVVFSKFTEIVFNNSNLRFSYRWDKAVVIQEKLIEMCNDCKRLDQYIISTKNGWSPECSEAASLNRVLGIDAIQKSTELSIENVKFTDETDQNIELNTVRHGDFFVSRGNTTDLVALASVANISEDDEEPIIFPDLMIRVNFNNQVNKKYMAYLFNSFVGRLYFKYVSKGKNQTMVKISQKELRDFYVPLPPLNEQQRIVDEIQAEIDKQNEIKVEMAKLRDEIDLIIEETIKE